jgi:isoleucyl-tRNA synthetase
VRAIQEARKGAGLNVEDRIKLTLGGDTDLLSAIREHEEYVGGETLAVNVTYTDGALSEEPVRIEGRELSIGVERA